MFRIVDDAVSGMLDVHPAELHVRLDWQEGGLKATVRGRAVGAPAAKSEAGTNGRRRGSTRQADASGPRVDDP